MDKHSSLICARNNNRTLVLCQGYENGEIGLFQVQKNAPILKILSEWMRGWIKVKATIPRCAAASKNT